MTRFLPLAVALMAPLPGAAQTQDKPTPKKPPPEMVKLFMTSPAEFIKMFDKNMNGFLEKDELPPRLAESFEKVDTNSDGKLDRQEVTQWLNNVRKALGLPEPGTGFNVEKLVDSLLTQFDTNKDGKISKDEARGRLADNFAQLDKNKDGFLDRSELRAVAEKMLALKKGPFPGGPGGPGGFPTGPDFDALDKNADGRLTKEELQGTPYFQRFDEIDTNRDGRIDRREFEAFLRKKS